MAAVFKRVFSDLVGAPSEAVVAAAVAAIGPAASEADARRYATETTQFVDKYSDLVRRLYAIGHDGSEPSAAFVGACVRRVAADPAYTPDRLADDIVSNRVFEEANDEKDKTPAEKAEPAEKAAAAADVAGMAAFASEWRRRTGRRIDVMEFVRYSSAGIDPKEMADAARRQDDAMLQVDAANRTYLGRGVAREEFLDAHVFQYDHPEFIQRVIAMILGGEEYRAAVEERIKAEHLRLYGEAVHADDMEYAFQAVRERRIALADEEVAAVVIHVNDQVIGISERVKEVYRRVLEREPDAEEVRERVMPWRALGDAECCARLAEELHASLEFHDVLKHRIRKKLEAANRPVKPRDVFDELGRVLRASAGDMSRALEHV
jgi:hypothetical protein